MCQRGQCRPGVHLLDVVRPGGCHTHSGANLCQVSKEHGGITIYVSFLMLNDSRRLFANMQERVGAKVVGVNMPGKINRVIG